MPSFDVGNYKRNLLCLIPFLQCHQCRGAEQILHVKFVSDQRTLRSASNIPLNEITLGYTHLVIYFI